MGRGILLWMLGVPLPIIILLALISPVVRKCEKQLAIGPRRYPAGAFSRRSTFMSLRDSTVNRIIPTRAEPDSRGGFSNSGDFRFAMANQKRFHHGGCDQTCTQRPLGLWRSARRTGRRRVDYWLSRRFTTAHRAARPLGSAW